MLPSKIFIDGGVIDETKKANTSFLEHFGNPLDGQTTNPSLIAKNLKTALREGEKLTPNRAIDEYKAIVTKISELLPNGSVSIQVLANMETKADDILTQAMTRKDWIPNGSIKIPCTPEGLKAAQKACLEMPLNITLVFSQSQAAAVYEATKDAKYPVFISPFIGRLDDIGLVGVDVVANMLRLYQSGDSHVEVLAASIRSLDHILAMLALPTNIITLPYKAFVTWEESSFRLPSGGFRYDKQSLKPIPFDESVSLGKHWSDYNIEHELTRKGLQLFWDDWQNLFS